MNLVLEIISTPNHSIFEQAKHFNQMGGKIGRNKQMDWVLHDPTKRISNFHAEIVYENNQYLIIDKSSNGTYFKTPHKRLTKDIPTPITQTTVIVIGDYEISVKLVNNTFINKETHTSMPSNSDDFNIPDKFFTGHETEKAFDIINQSENNNDILSMMDNDASSFQNDILPDFDNIIGDFNDSSEESVSHSLNVHIDDSSLNPAEPVEKNPTQTSVNMDEHLFKLLCVKLGVETNTMSIKEKEAFIQHIADLARVTVEQAQMTSHSMKSIKNQLVETGATAFNPLNSAYSSQEIFSKFQSYEQPLSKYISNLFQDINTHNIALFSAIQNVSLEISHQFSPQRLYFTFEQENLLNKKLANKKALAWDAYYTKFKYLDIVKNKEDLDMNDLKREYQSLLNTLNLGQHR